MTSDSSNSKTGAGGKSCQIQSQVTNTVQCNPNDIGQGIIEKVIHGYGHKA